MSSNPAHCQVFSIQCYACQWLATGQWFSQGTPVSSTNKTDCQDITEILLKVALNTINQTIFLHNLYIAEEVLSPLICSYIIFHLLKRYLVERIIALFALFHQKVCMHNFFYVLNGNYKLPFPLDERICFLHKKKKLINFLNIFFNFCPNYISTFK